jgi:hypothetical protein
VVYPSRGSGAIIEFTVAATVPNGEEYKPDADSVNAAFQGIKQRAIKGNLNAVHFSGTNTFVEDNRIILVKGEDGESSWGDEVALQDAKRVVERSLGRGIRQ